MSFESYRLDARITKGIEAAGYMSPTPIQERALTPALAGRDVLGLAQTGTGKTAAFVLPILQRLLTGPRGRIRALVVAPTRELAEQIHRDVELLGKATGVRSATVYGGVGFAKQEAALRGRAEVVVACPGRFLDHLGRGHVDLGALEVLVLDEADHMLDMGFLPDVRRILARVPADAQRMLFSATMPNELRGLVGDMLTDPVTVEVGRREPAATVDQALYPVDRKDKTALLKHVLREQDPRRALVFTRTKHGAKKLAAQLERDNHFVAAIQGNLSQTKRQKALDGFRNGDVHILVATDIAARGIDVLRISHVINYDMPDTVDAYIHRIGRTGRAERTGQALTFVTPDDHGMVKDIERRLGRPLQRVRVDGFEHAVAAQDPAADENGTSGTSRNGSSRNGSSRNGSSRTGNSRGGNARGGNTAGRGQGGRSPAPSAGGGGRNASAGKPSATSESAGRSRRRRRGGRGSRGRGRGDSSSGDSRGRDGG